MRKRTMASVSTLIGCGSASIVLSRGVRHTEGSNTAIKARLKSLGMNTDLPRQRPS